MLPNWPEDGFEMTGPPSTKEDDELRFRAGHGVENAEELEELVDVEASCKRSGTPPKPTLRRFPISCSLLVVASLSLLVLYSSFR